jgi:hypothetical protein
MSLAGYNLPSYLFSVIGIFTLIQFYCFIISLLFHHSMFQDMRKDDEMNALLISYPLTTLIHILLIESCWFENDGNVFHQFIVA